MDKPPKKSKKLELVEVAGQGALGAIPLVGSLAAAAFVAAVGHGFNQRQQQWFEDVAEAISKLQNRAELPPMEDLVDNPVFVDAVIRGTRAAQETSSAEKLRALRNGILNSVGVDAPSVDHQTRFIRLVDEFSLAHLKLLSFCQDARAALINAGVEPPEFSFGGSRMRLLTMLPGFQDVGWVRLLVKDLFDASLITLNPSSLGTTLTGPGVYEGTLTGLGAAFLRFVEDPAE